jgi:diacylglycerol kinase
MKAILAFFIIIIIILEIANGVVERSCEMIVASVAAM